MYTYKLPQLESTLNLGAKLAQLSPRNCVFFLQGPLGSGKTTFACGFLKELADFKRIKSPTYTLVEMYETTTRNVFHFDLYRLKSPLELEVLDIRGYTLTPAIWLIEWPEHGYFPTGESMLPQADIRFNFQFLPNAHQVTLEADTSLGQDLLIRLNTILT